MAYTRLSPRVLFGAAVILVGVLLLASTTGVYDTGRLLVYVPSLLIVVGVASLVTDWRGNLGGSLVLILVGGVWQAVALDLLTWAAALAYWPLLLILFGLSLVAGRLGSRAAATDDDWLDLLAVLGGRVARVTSQTFRGADATVVLGGIDLDLRDAAVVDSPARVDVRAVFGGVELAVPRDWNVRLDVVPVLGAAEDERLRTERDHEGVDLVVGGFVAFGGVSVTD